MVGIDDSEPSDAALEAVMNFRSRIVAASSWSRCPATAFVVGGSDYHQAALDELHEDAERVVDAALATARKRGCAFEVALSRPAANALVVTAEHDKVDLIVLGSHGRRITAPLHRQRCGKASLSRHPYRCSSCAVCKRRGARQGVGARLATVSA